jgi:peroxiredoxin
MSSKHIYAMCALALIGMNVWSLTVVRKLYHQEALQPPGVQTRSLSALREFQLKDGSRPLSDLGATGHFTVLYFFTPFDCPTAIEELAELEALRREQPKIEVRAVSTYASPEEARQTEKNFHLGFRVIADTDGRMKKLMKPPQTPWKVFYDPKTLHVIMEDGPSVASEEKKSFHNRIVYLLRAARQEAEPHR